MILCPHKRIIIDRPALHAAPTQNVSARNAAATGNERPRKVVWTISDLSGNARGGLTPPVEKKSISFPTVKGTSMDTPLETTSCSYQHSLWHIRDPSETLRRQQVFS
jgi:hypothetical protein